MAYIVPLHRPSDSRLAIKLNLLHPSSECLAVARYNRLEIFEYTLSNEIGSHPLLRLVASQPIYGRIVILNKFRPNNSRLDHIFIGTDLSHFFTLAWDPIKGHLTDQNTSYRDLHDSVAREVQTGERSHVDPASEFMLLEVYEGILTVIPLAQRTRKDLKTGVMGDPAWSRIPEYHVKSTAFIQRPRTSQLAKDMPKVALLWEDGDRIARIKIRQIALDPGHVEFKDRLPGDVGVDKENDELDFGASHLVPIQEEPYGLIVLGETSIAYYSDVEYCITSSHALPEATIWVAWTRIDNQRYILADDYGKLSLLFLQIDASNGVVKCECDHLGTTSRASCLVYLGNKIVFVGSHHGDSQVVQIQEKGLQVIQTLSNIAPILDFTVMDMGNRSGEGPGNEFSTGQARIVTGSGAWLDGSIRSVRSGVGVQQLALLEDICHVTALFPLRSSSAGSKSDMLLLSFAEESRLLRFGPAGDVEELEGHGRLALAEPTLYARNLPTGHILQVTRTAVRLLDCDSDMQMDAWSPATGEQLITSISATDNEALLSIDGERLVVLKLNGSLVQTATAVMDSQVSCVHLSKLLPGACMVGAWYNSAMSILSTDTLQTLKTITLFDQSLAVPRSILVSQLFPDSNPTLLVSMADGHVITHDMDVQSYDLSARKVTILGNRQTELTELPRQNGTCGVFVSGEQPSLIYSEEGRLTFSAVEAENVSSVCHFDPAEFPEAIAMATSKDLMIGTIDSERTTYVHPLHIGQVPRRLAYSPSLRAFGVGTIKRSIENGAEVISSEFQLVDEVVFRSLDSYALNLDEIVESAIRAQLDDGYGQMVERFIIGTSFLDDSSRQDYRGRIVVFEVREDRKLRELTSLNTKGACRSLAMMEDRIVAAHEKIITVYAYQFTSAKSLYLEAVASTRSSTIPVDIYVSNGQIAVADLMKSVSVLQYRKMDGANLGKDSLIEVARHVHTVWATAVAQIAPDTWLESDAEGNLLVLSRDMQGVIEEDKRRLRVDCEFRLGEVVNRIRTINTRPSTTAPVAPKAFLATREGALYLVGLILESRQNFLINLQEKLAGELKSPGSIDFFRYRAFSNEVRTAKEPKRFVDGDLVERFLDCGEELQKKCIEGLMLDGVQATLDQTRDLVEYLKRLH